MPAFRYGSGCFTGRVFIIYNTRPVVNRFVFRVTTSITFRVFGPAGAGASRQGCAATAFVEFCLDD